MNKDKAKPNDTPPTDATSASVVPPAGVKASTPCDDGLKPTPMETEPSKDISNQSQFLKLIEYNFCGLGVPFLIQLSVVLCMQLENRHACLSLITCGAASSGKSLLLSIFEVLDFAVVRDKISAASFAPAKNSEENSLLEQVANKLLISPELYLLFTQPTATLRGILGTLTRVLDGRGISYASAFGKSGDTRKLVFNWLAAVIEVPKAVWEISSNLGARLLFINIPKIIKSPEERLQSSYNMLKVERAFEAKIEILQKALLGFLEVIKFEINSHTWDRSLDDDEATHNLAAFGETLSILRGTIKSGIVSIESPARVITALHLIAAGFAIMNQRRQVAMSDIKYHGKIILDSIDPIRRRVFIFLLEKNKPLSPAVFRTTLDLSSKEYNLMTKIGMISANSENQVTLGNDLEVFAGGSIKANLLYGSKI